MKPSTVKLQSESMTLTMKNLLQDELLADVTFCCKEGTVKAHKLILASISPYLRRIFLNNTDSKTSIVFFGTNVSQLRSLVDLIYKGNIELASDKADAVFNLAEELEIEGIKIDETNESARRLRSLKNASLKEPRSDSASSDKSEKSNQKFNQRKKISKDAPGTSMVSDISVIVPRMDMASAKSLAWALKERKFKCDDCPADFKRPSHLARHQLVHTGHKPYVCHICQKTFSRDDKLKHHLRLNHDSDVEDINQLNSELPTDSLYTIGHVQILTDSNNDSIDLSAPIHHEDLPPPLRYFSDSANEEKKQDVKKPFPNVNENGEVVKRKPGRPRIHPIKLVKRPRGRPPKEPETSAKRLKKTDIPGKRRRGRPKSNPEQGSISPPNFISSTHDLMELPELSVQIEDHMQTLEEKRVQMANSAISHHSSTFIMEPLIEIKTEVQEVQENGIDDAMPVLTEEVSENCFMRSVGLCGRTSIIDSDICEISEVNGGSVS